MKQIAVWVYDHASTKEKFRAYIVAGKKVLANDNVQIQQDLDKFFELIASSNNRKEFSFHIVILHASEKRCRAAQVKFADATSIGIVIASNSNFGGLVHFQNDEFKSKGVVAITNRQATHVVEGIAGDGDSEFTKFLVAFDNVVAEGAETKLKQLFVDCFYRYFPDHTSEPETEKRKRIDSLINYYFGLSLSAVPLSSPAKQNDLIRQLQDLGVVVVPDDRE